MYQLDERTPNRPYWVCHTCTLGAPFFTILTRAARPSEQVNTSNTYFLPFSRTPPPLSEQVNTSITPFLHLTHACRPALLQPSTLNLQLYIWNGDLTHVQKHPANIGSSAHWKFAEHLANSANPWYHWLLNT